MNKLREFKYYFTIAILTLSYLAYSLYLYHTPNQIPVSTVIATTATLIAAVTFWLQLNRNQRLNESSFIMNLNNQFITNKDLTYVEQKLDLYYAKVRENADPNTFTLDLDMDRDKEDRQKLINYLVYLEALSVIIQQNTLHLGVIDDLFAYRFFIAVNNPVVQAHELLPFADYYQGCFKLSKRWSNKMGKRLPLSDSKLHECPSHLHNKPYTEPRKVRDEKN